MDNKQGSTRTPSAANRPDDEPRLKMSSRRRFVVIVGVMVGTFIAALEATVVGTAMPTVIASLGGLNHYSWVFSAYLVTSTISVPVWGKLSDLYGRRLLYQIGIAIFLLGTLLSGFSDSMAQLIVFRAIQGLGAGALVPLGMTIIGDIFTLEERGRMQAFFSAVWGISSVIGPVLGGFITDQLSWRWVFWINLPIGVAAATIIGFALKEPERDRRPSIDYAGAALLMTAISLLMLALVESGSTLETIFSPTNVVLFGSSIILLAAFYFVEMRAKEPIIPFSLFRNRTILVAVVAGFLAGVAMFGAISFIPLFAQGTLGFTATEAGSLLTPLMLSWVTTSIIGGRLLPNVGYRPMTVGGFLVLTAGFLSLYLFGSTTPIIWLYVDLVLIGIGLGMTMLTLLIAVQHAVDHSQLGIATSLNQFMRAIGGAVGVAVMGSILTAGLARNLRDAAMKGTAGLTLEKAAEYAADPNALIDPVSKAAIDPATLEVLKEAMAASIHNVFAVGAVMAFLAFIASLFFPRPRREDHDVDGESLIMAEQTTINARNQPTA